MTDQDGFLGSRQLADSLGPQPPGGLAVERTAVAMASAAGVAWSRLKHEERSHFRVMANAALMQLGVDGPGRGAAHLHEAVSRASDALRSAAAIADHDKERETTVRRFTACAMEMEVLAGLLAGVEPEEGV